MDESSSSSSDKPSGDDNPENPPPYPYSLFNHDFDKMTPEELIQHMHKGLAEIAKHKALAASTSGNSEQKSSLPETSMKNAATIGESSGKNPETPRRLIDFLEVERAEEASNRKASPIIISDKEPSKEESQETSVNREAKEKHEQSKKEGKRIVGFEETKLKMPMKENLSFLMRVQPAGILKNAVGALSDSQFNPLRMGMIEVGKAGFEITVNGSEDAENVFGFLSLKAVGLAEFDCPRPMRSMVSLHDMETILDSVDKDDSVTVFHVYGTNVLYFELTTPACDNAPSQIELLGDVNEYKKFPNVIYGFEDLIESIDLLSMINEAKCQPIEKRPQLVSLQVGTVVKVSADNFNVEKPGKNIQASIVWPYWESLEKAVHVAERCRLCFVTDPNDFIMLRFEAVGLGDLVYLVKGHFAFNSMLPCQGHFNSLL